MTELIIDNVHAVLSDDFSCTVKQENSFITKNGEYTYDCTMSLLNPTNAKLYGFLQRINKTESFATNRRVILIADNRVYCDGTEVITKWTNEKVTIQIVSGNSELNYFIGSDKKVSELDLGKADDSLTNVMNSIFNADELGYCFPVVEIGDTIYNEYHLTDTQWTDYGNFTHLTKVTLSATADSEWRAMPFINTMIKKIITALGYNITSNMLDDTKYKHMVLLHNVETTEFAKMLPGWTCKEFLEEVEKFFNLSFVINYKTKDVEIVTETSFYSKAAMVHIKNVKDAYETEIETDDDSTTNDSHATGNIGYDFTDNTYNKLRRLPTDIISKATKLTVDSYSDLENLVSDPRKFSNSTSESIDASMVLAQIKGNNDYYMYYDRDYAGTGLNNGQKQKEWQRCNEFKNLIQDSTKTDLDITLSIVPAQMTIGKVSFSASHKYNGTTTTIDGEYLAMPVIDADSSTKADDSTLYEYLEDESTNEESKGTIYAAFYDAPVNLKSDYTINGNDYISTLGTRIVTDASIDMFSVPSATVMPGSGWISVEDETFIADTENTDESFRLDKLSTLFYDKLFVINNKIKLTVESYDPNLYDTHKIFEILNKRWVCEYIEYTIDKDGRKGTWKGLFHPVTISDTDAEHRWILADSKWRDGGVWIDNGRWLDE